MNWLGYVAGSVLAIALANALTYAWRRIRARHNPAPIVAPVPVDTIRPDDPGWAEVDPLLTARRPISAIAAARRVWGLSLQDAKRLLEERSA